jgi:aspartyl protease family protein
MRLALLATVAVLFLCKGALMTLEPLAEIFIPDYHEKHQPAATVWAGPPEREPGALATVQRAALPRIAATGPGMVLLQPDRNGHYRANAIINGNSVPMLVDTGATLVSLSQATADAIGLRLSQNDFNAAMSTAGGVVRGARITLRELRIGDITAYNVPAVVMPRGLNVNLLGMSFLSKISGFSVQAGNLVLTR